MSAPLLLLVGLVYLGVAVDYWLAGRPGLAWAFVAYALANLGFATDAWSR